MRPSSQPAQSLIIHHFADLHRGREPGSNQALGSYMRRQAAFPERQPHVLIVTGDLTVTGTQPELHEVAFMLRNLYPQWDELALRQHVFILPGPHDIDWTTPNPSASFDAFTQEFRSFCIPLFPARDGNLLPGGEPYAQSFKDHYIVYALNTCYTPETMSKPLTKPLEDLVKRYRELWRDFTKSAKTATRSLGGAYDPVLRQQFLAATEELILRDVGIVSPADVDRFSATIQNMHLDELPLANSTPGDDQANPLRIIVTHHPLIAHVGRSGKPYGMANNSGALLRQLRRSGFHLALHGHTHEPHFISDLPIDSIGTNNDMPLLQVGAGSYGGNYQSNTFNEIVATRSPSSGKWLIEMTTINPDVENDRQPFRITLHNPQGGISNLQPTRVNEDELAVRKDFEHRLRTITRQFIDALENDVADIPARPLDSVKEAIKETIFAGIETRVSLALKQRPPGTNNIVLMNKYIVPDNQYDEQYLHPFSYPDTVAAWALVTGEVLIYPQMFHEHDAPVNFNWLQHTGKLEIIATHLREMGKTGKFPQRAQSLLSKIETRTLRHIDIFQDWLPAPKETKFKSFAAIPISLKTTLTRHREMGVLLVDVVDPDPQQPAAVFTEDRLDMLRTLAHLIDAILTAADKQRQPWGVWNIV